MNNNHDWHGTTIIAVRAKGKTVIAGDGQVSIGSTIFKDSAKKIRVLDMGDDIEKCKIIIGFAGNTADALLLYDKLKKMIEANSTCDIEKVLIELGKDFRSDKYVRKLEAMLIVADSANIFVVSGNGDVLKVDDIEGTDKKCTIAIGSGGNYALSSAIALLKYSELEAKEVALNSMNIAARICVYTNKNIMVEEIACNILSN